MKSRSYWQQIIAISKIGRVLIDKVRKQSCMLAQHINYKYLIVKQASAYGSVEEHSNFPQKSLSALFEFHLSFNTNYEYQQFFGQNNGGSPGTVTIIWQWKQIFYEIIIETIIGLKLFKPRHKHSFICKGNSRKNMVASLLAPSPK